MDCQFHIVKSEGGKHMLTCERCGRSRWGIYADPSMYKRKCQPKPAYAQQFLAPIYGPGRELTNLLASIGIKRDCGKCKSRARQMNYWGVAGCREHFDTIVGWVRESYKEATIKERLTAATLAVSSGLAFKLDPLDPVPGLVQEAIRRAELDEPHGDLIDETVIDIDSEALPAELRDLYGTYVLNCSGEYSLRLDELGRNHQPGQDALQMITTRRGLRLEFIFADGSPAPAWHCPPVDDWTKPFSMQPLAVAVGPALVESPLVELARAGKPYFVF